MPIIRAAGRRPILDVRNPAVAALRGGSTHTRASVHLHDGTAGTSDSAHEPRRRASDARAFATAAGTPSRDSGANVHAASDACDGGGGHDRLAARDAAFDRIIDRAVVAICEGGSRVDPVFGPYAALNSLVRAVTYHEGCLLEDGMAVLASENPSLSLMPPETELPIVPAALEILKRNDGPTLEGIRLSSEVHHKARYTPDLFIVDHARHSALIIDVKRSLGSYPERRLKALRTRMMASALIAADWLHVEGKVAGVSEVRVAIIDGSSERHDPKSGIFALEEIGHLIGIPDAGEAMIGLRAKFASRIQAEIRAACLRAIGGDDGPAGAQAAVGDPSDLDEVVEDDDAGGSAVFDDGEHDLLEDDEAGHGRHDDTAGAGLVYRRAARAATENRRPSIVGFARGGVP
jgi:hypothetical protein